MAATPPASVLRLLWDVDPASVDIERDAAFLMERVMARGTWNARCWLRATCSRAARAAVLLGRGMRVLAPREIAYRALVMDTEVPPATGGGRPRWAGS